MTRLHAFIAIDQEIHQGRRSRDRLQGQHRGHERPQRRLQLDNLLPLRQGETQPDRHWRVTGR